MRVSSVFSFSLFHRQDCHITILTAHSPWSLLRRDDAYIYYCSAQVKVHCNRPCEFCMKQACQNRGEGQKSGRFRPFYPTSVARLAKCMLIVHGDCGEKPRPGRRDEDLCPAASGPSPVG